MTTRMHRTQILLEPEQHQALTEIARREKRSLSDVVREMLQVQLMQRRQDATAVKKQRLEALERIRRHRQTILDRRGGKPLEIDAVELINQIRDDRDGAIAGAIQNRG
jgi:predicted CopG family antitoxin